MDGGAVIRVVQRKAEEKRLLSACFPHRGSRWV